MSAPTALSAGVGVLHSPRIAASDAPRGTSLLSNWPGCSGGPAAFSGRSNA